MKKWWKWQKKVTKKLKEEVEKTGLKLSVTENGKEGKMIASCGFGLEVEEELSTMAFQYLAEGALTRKWSHEQKERGMRQIREVQTLKQVRGPAGAVMSETRDLGIKWPCWHTLVLGDEIKIDVRHVCPKDVKKCWYCGPGQCTGRSGQPSTSMNC